MFYRIIRFIVNIYISLYYKIEVDGRDNIPSTGALILASNHIHWADPVILACKSTKREIHYMGKAELFKNRLLALFLTNLHVFPIKRGESDVGAIKKSLRVLKDGHVLGIFPEGTRVKEDSEKKPESGFVMLGVKSKATIVPTGISSTYKFRSTITVKIGTPIVLEDYYGKKLTKEILDQLSSDIMVEIKNLRQLSKDI